MNLNPGFRFHLILDGQESLTLRGWISASGQSSGTQYHEPEPWTMIMTALPPGGDEMVLLDREHNGAGSVNV